LFKIATTTIGANELAGFVIRAFVPNTMEDCGNLKSNTKMINMHCADAKRLKLLQTN